MSGRVVVLTGGVGGAKLVRGLCAIMAPKDITAIVNTGDDFRHLGLWVSPDIDTLLYTLSDKNDDAKGWGRGNETWTFMDALRSVGGEDWFLLGDGDLALHVERTRLLASGMTLSEVTQRFATAWDIGAEILPMSDAAAPTILDTPEGVLSFQDYFVARKWAPTVSAIRFPDSERANAAPRVLERLTDPGVRAIIIAPSNPYLSVDPILALPEIRSALEARHAPAIAVSPLVGGQAVKGPTRKLMDELGVEATPVAIAAHYAELIDGILIDERDKEAPPPHLTHDYGDTLMRTLDDRKRVARASLDLAARIARR